MEDLVVQKKEKTKNDAWKTEEKQMGAVARFIVQKCIHLICQPTPLFQLLRENHLIEVPADIAGEPEEKIFSRWSQTYSRFRLKLKQVAKAVDEQKRNDWSKCSSAFDLENAESHPAFHSEFGENAKLYYYFAMHLICREAQSEAKKLEKTAKESHKIKTDAFLPTGKNGRGVVSLKTLAKRREEMASLATKRGKEKSEINKSLDETGVETSSKIQHFRHVKEVNKKRKMAQKPEEIDDEEDSELEELLEVPKFNSKSSSGELKDLLKAKRLELDLLEIQIAIKNKQNKMNPS